MKKMSIVKYISSVEYEEGIPFKHGERLLFLGEIRKMSGHCAVVKRNGKVLWGYHTDHFIECTEDEI